MIGRHQTLITLAAICTTLISCATTDPAELKIPGLTNDKEQIYLEEKQKLLDRDPNVDFHTLRWAFRSSRLYKTWDTQEHEASLAMFNAFQDQDYALCMQFANAMLDLNYTSLAGHFGAYSCQLALNEPTKATFHRYVISGLIESIEASGDGQSPETAFVTISPSEMRGYLQIRGLTSYRQELVDTKAKYIEKMFVISNETEEHLELYFDNSSALVSHIQPKPTGN